VEEEEKSKRKKKAANKYKTAIFSETLCSELMRECTSNFSLKTPNCKGRNTLPKEVKE